MNKLESTNDNMEFHFEAAIHKASLRVGMEATDIKLIVADVLQTFQNVDKKVILEAIKKGSLGCFGRTYRLSSQEVCLWVREYLSVKSPSYASQNNTDREQLIKKLENDPQHDRNYVLSYTRRK